MLNNEEDLDLDKLNKINISFNNGRIIYTDLNGKVKESGITKEGCDIIIESTLGQILP